MLAFFHGISIKSFKDSFGKFPPQLPVLLGELPVFHNSPLCLRVGDAYAPADRFKINIFYRNHTAGAVSQPFLVYVKLTAN